MQDIAGGYQAQLQRQPAAGHQQAAARCCYAAGGSPRAAAIAANQPAVRDALAGHESLSLLPQPNGILQVVTVPVTLERPRREILGTLSVGFLLDDALAAQLKQITGSDIAFGMDGQILASTLPREHHGGAGRAPAHHRHLARCRSTARSTRRCRAPLAAGGDARPSAPGRSR